jgi:hypothetical protein
VHLGSARAAEPAVHLISAQAAALRTRNGGRGHRGFYPSDCLDGEAVGIATTEHEQNYFALVQAEVAIVGHTLLCIADSSKAKSQKHAYDNMYDRTLIRIEFSHITD